MCLAIPGQIVEMLDDAQPLAVVAVSGVRRRINIDLLQDEPLGVGDWVLIHVGFAMTRISSERAEQQLRLLALMGEDRLAVDEVLGYGSAEVPEAPS